jgi:hypothetical protein
VLLAVRSVEVPVATSIEERIQQLEERVGEIEVAIRGRQGRQIGITIEEALARLGTPVQRSESTKRQFQALLGRFEGPKDLSENMRDYLYGERE